MLSHVVADIDRVLDVFELVADSDDEAFQTASCARMVSADGMQAVMLEGIHDILQNRADAVMASNMDIEVVAEDGAHEVLGAKNIDIEHDEFLLKGTADKQNVLWRTSQPPSSLG